MESTGQVHFLDVVCNTYRGMQSNGRPVTSLGDFEGLTLRVQAGELYADITTPWGQHRLHPLR